MFDKINIGVGTWYEEVVAAFGDTGLDGGETREGDEEHEEHAQILHHALKTGSRTFQEALN